MQQLIEVHPGYFTQVRVAADMARAKRDKQLGIILSFESADMLGGRLDSLRSSATSVYASCSCPITATRCLPPASWSPKAAALPRSAGMP